jgi:hypothetical protein
MNPSHATEPAERRAVVRAPVRAGAGARAGGPCGEFSCAGRVFDASPRGLGLLLHRPFPPGAAVVVELNPACLRYGVVAVAWVVHAAARPDGYLIGCSLLSPLPGDLLRHLSGGAPG